MQLNTLFLNLFFGLFCLWFSSCLLAQDDNQPVGKLTDVNATVTLVANQYTLVPDDNDSQRYFPRNLDAKFKVEGLKVTVSGNIYPIPPNVRMIGTPFEITKIQVRNETNGLQPPVKPQKGAGLNNDDKTGTGTVENTTGYAEVDYNARLTNVKGTILLIGNTYIIETGANMRYYPMNLAPEYKVEKLAVTFSGMAGAPPPNVRMKGHPLKITDISKTPVKKWWQFWK